MTSHEKAWPKVVVCQNKTCKQQGSERVMAAFVRCVPEDVTVEASGCLGQCGNGPTVIVLTEDKHIEKVKEISVGILPVEEDIEKAHKPVKTWYAAVKPVDAFAIASQHFKDDSRLVSQSSVLPQKQQSFFWIWLVGLILFFSMCGLMALVLGGPSHYG